MTRGVLRIAVAFALGVAAERWRRDWQASAWAYHRRYDRMLVPVPRASVSQDQRRP